MNVKRIIGSVLILAGIASLGASGWLLRHNNEEDKACAESTAERLELLTDWLEEQDFSEEERTEAEIEELVIGSEATETPRVELNGDYYLGILSLPSVGYETPIMNEWSMERLKYCPCRYYGSPQTQDFVIAGHNYKSSFGKLHKLNIGDEVQFLDVSGELHQYVIQDIEVLGATDVPQMIQSGWALSLYTCTYGGRERLTIRCAETESE